MIGLKMTIQRRLVPPHLFHMDEPRVEHIRRIRIFLAAILRPAAFDHALHCRQRGRQILRGKADGSDDQQHAVAISWSLMIYDGDEQTSLQAERSNPAIVTFAGWRLNATASFWKRHDLWIASLRSQRRRTDLIQTHLAL